MTLQSIFLGLAALTISTASALAQPGPPPPGPGPGGPGGPGLGGAIIGGVIGGMLAAPPPPGYYPGPQCRIVQERWWDGYAYRIRRVRYCD